MTTVFIILLIGLMCMGLGMFIMIRLFAPKGVDPELLDNIKRYNQEKAKRVQMLEDMRERLSDDQELSNSDLTAWVNKPQ